jgi:pimeloyl-ACP methyl ester carboxylesterase
MATILLIHGAFVNARCWEGFQARYGAAGHAVHAPSWPFDDGEPARLRAEPPQGLAQVGVEDLVKHYAEKAAALPELPILIGRSFGGLIVQRLLDRGVGRCGVAIHPAPPRGVFPTPGLVAANAPMVANPFANGTLKVMDREHWARRFANGVPRGEAEAAWERLCIPTPTKIFFEGLLLSSSFAVDFASDTRPPLLIFGGTRDQTVPVQINRSNARKFKGRAKTEYREWQGRSHFTIAEPGWEEVADAALAWGLGQS